MIPIGNGIQLVWITTLGHDNIGPPLLSLSHTVREWKAFLPGGGKHSQTNHFKSGTVKKERTPLVCIIFTNYICTCERIYKSLSSHTQHMWYTWNLHSEIMTLPSLFWLSRVSARQSTGCLTYWNWTTLPDTSLFLSVGPHCESHPNPANHLHYRLSSTTLRGNSPSSLLPARQGLKYHSVHRNTQQDGHRPAAVYSITKSYCKSPRLTSGSEKALADCNILVLSTAHTLSTRICNWYLSGHAEITNSYLSCIQKRELDLNNLTDINHSHRCWQGHLPCITG